ncbi:MAG: sigma-70 family RNA polymerase sigma factor [Saprospiraceae bacterium]|nr:sigma-70 family RNA polymerase sigma factor [Saprospiraceae bacterium]
MEAQYTETALLGGLKQRDLKIMKYLYTEYMPMIRDHITRNGGSDQDAADIFQDGMVVCFEKCADSDFQWTSTLKTYLYAVCKNKWLMQLRKKRNRGTTSLPDNLEMSDSENIHQDIIQHEQKELMRKHFRTLGTDCQSILQMFFEGMSLRKIGETMNFTEAYAKKRKFVCQQRLIKAITQDPLHQELSAL